MFSSVADDMLGLSFQLASLNENAAIYLWVMHIHPFSHFVAFIFSALAIIMSFNVQCPNSVGSESDLGQWKFRTGPCAASIHAY